ncbi:hypothetical protein D8B26_008198 [Coccidioides posadasii str. Silveira]|uniref:DUF1746 domain-containing protein n=1 Tax=Coccidioides posadasii (strain RMSCC 757 / Silveira) TaxID=443226 RepID=E9DGH4_COCPS|nr:conserved hypothetical protein [Coccidioides posadasii str. Silveira]QVM13590.1 hypothetical protein D8B26_008198 [Coccidioides posadasii str. Silveira]
MTTPDALRDAEHIADISNFSHDNDDERQMSSQLLDARKDIRSKAKTVLLNRLLHDFDLLIYCQLSSLYYMDCSIFHFAIRAVIQFGYLTPKPTFEPPENQPYIGAILTSNLLCMFLHCISAAPIAGEVSRGYLHGGLFIDFIGQKGPISKVRLIVMDILVMILQIIMMGIILEKENVKATSPRESSNSASGSHSPTSASRASQDIDSEERGVRRSRETEPPGADGIELQNLQPSDAQNNIHDERNEERDHERHRLLSDATPGAADHFDNSMHPRDEFLTGDSVIMELNIYKTFRDQWRRNTRTSTPAESSGSSTSISPRVYFRRRFGAHFGAGF